MKSLLLVALLSVLPPFGSASAIGPASKLDIVVTAPGVPVDIRPLENDSDPEGDELRLSTFTQPQHGSIEETSPGVLRYTPREGYAGRDAFRYSASDGTTQSSQTVYVYVSTTGKPWPVISDSLGGYITPSSNLIYALSSNVDPDGNPLTIESFTQPAVGRVFLVGPGVFMYQNSGYWSTHVEFTYRVSNGSAISNTAKVVRIADQWGGPTAGTYAWGDSAIIAPDDPVDISVLSNDYDRQAWAVTLTGFTQPANGIVTEPSPGILRYVPKPGFIGQDQFGYSVKSHFATGATVRITVTDQTGPQMQDDTGKTAIGESVDLPVLANDFELRGGTIALVDFTQPAHGTVTQVGLGQVRYTPQPGFVGQDTFKYRATNGNGISEAAVQVDVLNRRRPVVTEDAIVTPFRTPVTIPVLLNDVAPEGGSLVITEFIPPANGTISLSSSGTISYSPRSDFAGEDRFSYVVSDGVLSAQGNVRVTVNANGAPVAQADSASTISTEPVLIYVLGNDYDPDNAGLSIKAVGSPAHGTASVDYSQKLITYKSEAGFVGTDEFTYTVTDGVTTAQGIVRVTVGGNRPPVAGDDQGFGTPGVKRSIYIRDNDGDPETGGDLYAILVTPPTHGAVNMGPYNSAGALFYEANAGFEGQDELTYKAFDGNSYSAPATVRITVRANNRPTAVDDYVSISVGSTAMRYLRVLDNDFDPDSDSLIGLRVVSATEAANGAVEVINGDVYYTPGPSYNGTDHFTYTVSDGQGGTATASVTISAQSNAAPQVKNDTARLPADASFVVIPVLSNDSDPDGDTLVISTIQNGGYGLVCRVGSDLIYRQNFSNQGLPAQGFDQFNYYVSDGHGNESIGTVRIDFSNSPAQNSIPIARADTVEITGTTPVTINVLENDSDSDGDVLTISIVSGVSKGTVQNAGNSIVYTRYEKTSGTDTFHYTISDGRGGSSTAIVTVTGGNSTPIARDDVAGLFDSNQVTINVLANDSDPDGDVLTISSVSTASKGSAVQNGNSIVYTRNAGVSGTDTFTYTISDGRGGTATAKVTVSIPGTNSPPVAHDDDIVVVGQSPVTINVLVNDSDPDGDVLTISSVSTASKGSAVQNGSSIVYTRNAGVSGTDTFTYTISDGRGGTATAKVTVSIPGTNSPPVAHDDDIVVVGQSPVTINVLVNDSDPDGDVLTISSVSTASKGSAVQNGSSIVYTRNAGVSGTDTFTYTISDGRGGTATAKVTVSIPGTNSPPVAHDDDIVVVGQSPVTIDVLANDSDADGDELVIGAVSTAKKGNVLKSGSSLIYTPSTAMEGADTFTYTVKDGRGGVARATVTVTITNAPQSAVLFATGDAVPRAGEPESGIPADAVFQSFGIPSINDAGATAFLGTWRTGQKTLKGIFAGDPVLPIVQTGESAPETNGQLSETARFETIKDPLFNTAGDVAFVAALSGVPSGSKSGIWIKPHDGPLRQVVRIGQDAAGISGAVWKAITSVALTDAGTIPFVAKVEGGRASRSAIGLWMTSDTGVHLLLRQGDTLDVGGTARTVKDFVALAPVQGSPGQGRLSENGVPVRIKWTDGTQSLLVFAPDTVPVLVSSSGDAAPDGGTFESLGFPTLNRSGQLGVLAKVKASVGARTNGLGKMGVFAQSPDGEFSLVVREGDPAPGPLARTARFKSFQTPVYNVQLRTAFVARIAGRDVGPSNNQGVWWTRPDGSLAWIGQTNIGPVDIGPGPTSAGWASFTSLALPDGPTAGPIFTAKVKTGGPRKASYSGLWAANSTGLARNVVRTGQTILVGGQGKVVRTFHALEMVPGSPAQPRSYNGQKQLAYQVTFTDGTSAILQAQLY